LTTGICCEFAKSLSHEKDRKEKEKGKGRRGGEEVGGRGLMGKGGFKGVGVRVRESGRR
jgi:hypothetical protein